MVCQMMCLWGQSIRQRQGKTVSFSLSKAGWRSVVTLPIYPGFGLPTLQFLNLSRVGRQKSEP